MIVGRAHTPHTQHTNDDGDSHKYTQPVQLTNEYNSMLALCTVRGEGSGGAEVKPERDRLEHAEEEGHLGAERRVNQACVLLWIFVWFWLVCCVKVCVHTWMYTYTQAHRYIRNAPAMTMSWRRE